jgi:AcrR family transcriptional regulator
MTTKEKIISKAIDLYNEQGFANITSRDIAKELKISHGNLEYHYQNKETLLSAIYMCMKEEVSSYFAEIDQSQDPFVQFDTYLRRLEPFQTKYLFFNLDVLEISRKYPAIKEKLDATILLRKEQMTHFFNLFDESGYLQPEPSKEYYTRLQHKIRVLITFWVSQEAVLQNFHPGQHISMTVSIWDLLLPHLTEKGKRQYKNVSQALTPVLK